MSNVTVQARISPELKRQADAIFAAIGLSTADAIRVFLQQTVHSGGLPFRPTAKMPNAETREAMTELEEGRGQVFSTTDELFAEQRYREIEELVSEVEQLREATAEYHVGIKEGQPTVVRNHFGLSIGGTRLTLYSIMDYIKDGWSPILIQRWFNFTDRQIDDIMEYIKSHREEVEAEYQEVLEEAERNRMYWTERNKDLLAQTEQRIQTEQGPVWDKLRAQRAKLQSQ